MARILWTQRQHFGPPARSSHSMAFDSTRNRVVLFGGLQPTASGVSLLGDTWEWDGDYWTQMADTGPVARRSATMAFDHTRGRLILFGGDTSEQPVSTEAQGDTWEWDGEDWTQLAEKGPARAYHGMASDPIRKRVTIFGGGGLSVEGDTWEWDGDQWTQQTDTGPGARLQCCMAFDTVKGRTILFGGSASDRLAEEQTWAWDGKTWTQVSEIGPGQVTAHSMADTGNGVLLYGGFRRSGDSDFVELGETWVWNGMFWSQRQDIGPGIRSSVGLAYDALRERAVLFGGEQGRTAPVVFGDTWEANPPG